MELVTLIYICWNQGFNQARLASQPVTVFIIPGGGLEPLPYLNVISLLHENKRGPGPSNLALWYHKHPHRVITSVPNEPQYGMGGESTWGAEGLLGKDGCLPCLRCIPAAPSSPPTPPGSEESIWSRALEHNMVTSQPKPKEEKGLSCWVTPTAAICERGRCGEGACSCR